MAIKRFGNFYQKTTDLYYGSIQNNTPYQVLNSNLTFNVVVPNLIGLSYNQAVAALSGLNLNYSIFSTLSSNNIRYQPFLSQGGYVSFQSPPAGPYFSGSTVNLQVVLYNG
jgi:beta-lactam-binding protein with PASTA domain